VSNRDHLRQVTGWLSDLANLTAGTAPLVDAKTKIAAIASMLAEDFPAGAFTRQSLNVVARACKFFPSYSELCSTLGPWWIEHRPPPSQVAISQDDKRAKEEREEQERSDSWRDITDEQVRAKIRALHGHPKRQELGHFLAIAVKRNAPAKLGMLPPEWLDAPTEPAKVIAMRRPPQAVTDA
jgi:hypothetical protein